VARQGAAPLGVARHIFVQRPAQQAWEQIESKFPEIHKQQQHSKLSRKSQAGCAKVTNPSKWQDLQIVQNDKVRT
jgi:hypothetical protein